MTAMTRHAAINGPSMPWVKIPRSPVIYPTTSILTCFATMNLMQDASYNHHHSSSKRCLHPRDPFLKDRFTRHHHWVIRTERHSVTGLARVGAAHQGRRRSPRSALETPRCGASPRSRVLRATRKEGGKGGRGQGVSRRAENMGRDGPLGSQTQDNGCLRRRAAQRGVSDGRL